MHGNGRMQTKFHLLRRACQAAEASERNGYTVKILICLLSIFLFSGFGCSDEQRYARPGDSKETARGQRQQYQDQIEATIRDLNAKIDHLAARIEKQKAEGIPKSRRDEYHAKLREQMAELDRRREIARQKLDRLRNSGEDVWQTAKAEIEAAVKDLQAEYEQVESHLK